MSKGEGNRVYKGTAKEQIRRERSDSLSILDYIRREDKERDSDKNKRKRVEREKGAEDIFKRRMLRSPPSSSRDEENRHPGEEGTLIKMMRDLKEEMTGLRNEIKEIKEKWVLRVDRMENKMVEMEERMKNMEKQMGEREFDRGDRIEYERGDERDVLGQEVRRLKRTIEVNERKGRKNNIVIRGLGTTDKAGNIKDVARKWLEQKFEIKDKIKLVHTAGFEGKEITIVELDEWKTKEKIMKEKSKLRGEKIYIDHDMTREEREVQRKIRMRAREEKEAGRIVKVGYRKIFIGGIQWVWNEEVEELRTKTSF